MGIGGSPKPRHNPVRQDWLALREEAAIDPAVPLIDAHHHLWDKPGACYLRAEMEADIGGGHNVVATVFADGKWGYREGGDEALRSLGETETMAEIAASCERSDGDVPLICAGIVGYVDLALGARAGAILDLHLEAGGGRFCGVRNTSAWHADPEARGSVLLPPEGLLAMSGFRAGIAELARRGLVFDAWMYHTQLDDLVDLADRFPDASFVLDHIGGPIGIGPYAGRRAEVFAAWREGMRRVAAAGNVCVKLGGLGMPMSGFGFEDAPLPPSSDELARAWGPYFETCIELFGAARCMFETNFPVDKGTASYTVTWNAFKKIVAGCSETEREALFFANADRVYSLGLRETSNGPVKRG